MFRSGQRNSSVGIAGPLIGAGGTSPSGPAVAARNAEAVYTVAPTSATLRGYVENLRRAAGESGRDPRSLKVFTEICTVVAPTDAEARAKYEDLLSWTDYEGALAFYAGVTGIDLSQLDPDQPLEYVGTDSARFALEIFCKADPDRGWTPNEVARFVGIGAMGPAIVGSPATVADELERWSSGAGAATGMTTTRGRRCASACTGRASRGCATTIRRRVTGAPWRDRRRTSPRGPPPSRRPRPEPSSSPGYPPGRIFRCRRWVPTCRLGRDVMRRELVQAPSSS
jgi:hypothetical protein